MSADLLPLLPFQKLVDVPESLQRFRVPVKALAVTEFVLAALLVPACFHNPLNSISVALTLLCTSIVLINTNRWVQQDCCFNLVRRYPTCCSKACGGPRTCCCSRLSNFHFGITGVVCCANIGNIAWALFWCPMMWLAVIAFVVIFGCMIASGILIRKIELDLEPVALLPANKMVCATPETTVSTETTTPVVGIPVVAHMTNVVSVKTEQADF